MSGLAGACEYCHAAGPVECCVVDGKDRGVYLCVKCGKAPEDTNIDTILRRNANGAIADGRHPMYEGAHRVGCTNTVDRIPPAEGSLAVLVVCCERHPCDKCEQDYNEAVIEANDFFQSTAYR